MSEKTIFAVNVLRSRVGLNSGSFPTGRASRSCVLSGIRAVKKNAQYVHNLCFPLNFVGYRDFESINPVFFTYLVI
jgi:hypothetical protein